MDPKSNQAKPSIVLIASIALALLLTIGWFFWNPAPSQLGDNERAFSAVDALFTAVTARNEQLLADCEARLKALVNEGVLDDKNSEYLASVVAQAKTGQWQQAARRLYKFMQGQRRQST
jgi:ammonia channel protein AmtB